VGVPPAAEKGDLMNPTQQLHEAGQNLWLDSINRKMLQDGTLSGYIDHLALTGLTSNPTILGHAMAAGSDYDDSLRTHLAAGTPEPEELVFSVALEDITAAADLFRPVWDRTDGVDGYVSIEVPPGLAYDPDQPAHHRQPGPGQLTAAGGPVRTQRGPATAR